VKEFQACSSPGKKFSSTDMIERNIQLEYLDVTVREKLHNGWTGPFVKVEGCCD
jgi:hypothetical protein